MPTPNSTLAAIQTKVRRLTRTPSTAQLSEDDLNNYINTFVVYDFPEHLRTFNLRTTFTFYTTPYQDTYVTDTSISSSDPLYNFQNNYITLHPPVYIAGYQVWYSQSREQFFAQYPIINFINQIATGDGVTTSFSGTLSTIPVLANQVLFSSVDSSNNGLALIDDPIDNSTGNLVVPGTTTSLGTINYVTGAYSFTFSTAPASGAVINSQTVPYQASLPTAMLYYNNTFTVRPVPDQPYRVNFEVYARPTALLQTNQSPQLEEWWQYIAYGAAKKIFEDRMDMDSVQMIMPEFKKQEALVLRRTLVQYSNERVATIYSEQTDFKNQNWSNGGPF